MIILHNAQEKDSRNFVEAHGAEHDVIDWFNDDSAKTEYLSKGYPHPSGFPALVEPKTGAIACEVSDIDHFASNPQETVATVADESRNRLYLVGDGKDKVVIYLHKPFSQEIEIAVQERDDILYETVPLVDEKATYTIQSVAKGATIKVYCDANQAEGLPGKLVATIKVI